MGRMMQLKPWAPSTDSWKRVLTIAAAVVVTMLLLESMARCWVLALKLPDSHVASFDVKLALAKEPTPPGQRRILLLGDSKIWHSIYPELLEVQLKRSNRPVMVTNHGVSGATPRMNQVVLAQALKHGIKPDVVVYNVSPMLLNRWYFQLPGVTPQFAFDSTYTGRCIAPRLLHSRQTWDQRVVCGIERWSQLLRHRSALAEQLKPLVNQGFMPQTNPLIWRVEAPHLEGSLRGWSPDSHVIAAMETDFDVEAFIASVKLGKSLTSFEEDPRELQGFLQYCQQQHVPVVLVWLPEHPVMTRVYRELGVPPASQLEHMMSTLTSPASPGSSRSPVWLLNLRDADTDSTHYYNPDHLNVLGSIKATGLLQHFLAKTVWPTLPRDVSS